MMDTSGSGGLASNLCERTPRVSDKVQDNSIDSESNLYKGKKISDIEHARQYWIASWCDRGESRDGASFHIPNHMLYPIAVSEIFDRHQFHRFRTGPWDGLA